MSGGFMTLSGSFLILVSRHTKNGGRGNRLMMCRIYGFYTFPLIVTDFLILYLYLQFMKQTIAPESLRIKILKRLDGHQPARAYRRIFWSSGCILKLCDSNSSSALKCSWQCSQV